MADEQLYQHLYDIKGQISSLQASHDIMVAKLQASTDRSHARLNEHDKSFEQLTIGLKENDAKIKKLEKEVSALESQLEPKSVIKTFFKVLGWIIGGIIAVLELFRAFH